MDKKPGKDRNASTAIENKASQDLLSRFKPYIVDIVAVGLIAIALMTLVAWLFPSQSSDFFLRWVEFIRLWFGYGIFWVVGLLIWTGIFLLRLHSNVWHKYPWRRLFAFEIMAFTSLALLSITGGNSLQRAENGLDGGRIGWGLAYPLDQIFKNLGAVSDISQVIFLSCIMLVSFLLAIGIYHPLQNKLRKYLSQATYSDSAGSSTSPAVVISPLKKDGDGDKSETKPKRLSTRLPAEFRKKFSFPSPDENGKLPTDSLSRDERLPGLDLLATEITSRPDERNINLTAGLIEKTLSEFGIPAKVVGFRVGPTVTQFAVEPGFLEKMNNGDDANKHKVRVAQISSLSRDLALALSAERLRIEAPVPGRAYVGIEVPNTRSSVVRLRPILETEAFYRVNSPISIALGRDVSGQPLVADLASMPHLLVAGTTGSGKSVCIAAITTCLVMNNTPEDLRIIMIDPKMVELIRFNGLPHLYGNVETNLERILGVLRWTVAEMDRRYKLLESTNSRNIESYNRKARRRKDVQTLPRIVVLIDELADLMMSTPEHTEQSLVRLAQMARATGIHLVVATQRPSTDVVTGLIKANFPARLSFAVASSVDSRVILDCAGAEALLGKGDMLFLPPESSTPIRCQGVMVSDQEVENVINFWQKTVQDQTVEPPPWEEMLKQEVSLADQDELIEEAIKIIRQSQHASTSMLQRRLRVGYPRAARLVDDLEKMGIIGPAKSGGKEREVLISPEDELMDSGDD